MRAVMIIFVSVMSCFAAIEENPVTITIAEDYSDIFISLLGLFCIVGTLFYIKLFKRIFRK